MRPYVARTSGLIRCIDRMDKPEPVVFIWKTIERQWYWIEEMTDKPLSQAMAGEIVANYSFSALPASRSGARPAVTR